MIDLQIRTDTDQRISKIAKLTEMTDLNNYFYDGTTLNQPNTKSGMNELNRIEKKDIVEKATARSYDMSDGVIHESFSQLEHSDDSAIILSETDLNPANDLIVVLSDYVRSDELVNLYNKFKNRIKVIIYYGNNTSVKQIFRPCTKIISANSLKKAVNKSYLLLKNGQTILFPRIGDNFDFFGNIDFA